MSWLCLSDDEWRVFIDLTCEIFCHQPRLQFDTTPVFHFVAKDGMGDLFVESLLESYEECLARLFFQAVRA
jgi:hypothetical protein